MRAQPDRLEDKLYLQRLSTNLRVSYSRIKLDECGDWNIVGDNGHIFTECVFWYIYVSPGSKRKWNSIKDKLHFMIVSQDGDEEGILKLDRMPNVEEAKLVRKVLGMRIRTELTEEERASLKNRFNNPSPEGVSRSRINLNEVPARVVPVEI